MDFSFTPEQEKLKKEFEQFFSTEMKKAPPVYETGGLEAMFGSEEGWEFHLYMARELGKKGWLAMAWPEKYGGKDASVIDQVIFSEVRGYYGAPGVDIFGIGIVAPTLLVAASEEQREKFLPPIAKGEVMYCQGWSEPNAGSDLASLSTSAVKDGDDYIINGQKIWTSGAHRADWMFILVRTDLNEKRSKGLTYLLLDMKTPGITIRPIEAMDGLHMFNEVFFDDVRVPIANRIGEENKGWEVTRQSMNFERSSIGIFSENQRTIEDLVKFVKETKKDGKPLAENQVIRNKLAELAAATDVGRAMAYNIAWMQEKGGLFMAASAASAAKVFGSELAQRLVYVGAEILGQYSQVKESKWAPLNGKFETNYQNCMGLNIAGGTSEIQRNLVAWIGLGLPR
ncbi:MAG: acyl-CoA dehydrogenase family protein [Thermodesulfobacteriota bacterium]|nr:acyl-CoA dehydrogenase family protein [Thermodesulfobacteriota bacterium]